MDTQSALVELAAESWRFAKEYRRLLLKLDANEQPRFTARWNYYAQRIEFCLDQAGLRLVNLEGQPYEIGIAAQVLNLDEFAQNDLLVVDQMIEPLIMGKDGVVKTGKVMVRRVRS